MVRRKLYFCLISVGSVALLCLWIWTANKSILKRTAEVEENSLNQQLPELMVRESRQQGSKLLSNSSSSDLNLISISNDVTQMQDIKNKTTSFKDIVKKRASPTSSLIILAYVDLPFIDMALNFYETSLKRFGLQNFLFAASDSACCDAFKAIDPEACYIYKRDAASLKASAYGSKDFLRKMNIRTDMILEALEAGVTVLHSDTDIYFAKNPLDHIECKNCDLATLMDTSDYNAGFLLIHPTQRSNEVYKKMKTMSIKSPNVDDQDQLTKTIREFSKKYKDFKIVKLPTDKFLCGLYYFENGKRNFAGDNQCADCVVIHNNWIVSKEAKVYRFKESLMWDYDGGHYYTSDTNKYLKYDNPVVFENLEKTKEMEKNALVSALALGQVLNRIVILPKFHCDNKKVSTCPLNSLFRLTHFDKIFGGNYREHVFLQHAKVPASVKTSISNPILIVSDIILSNAELMQSLPNNTKRLIPADKANGATDKEILQWLNDQTEMVLHFHSLYKAFHKFEANDEQENFNSKIKSGLTKAAYRQF